jgi:hypothetical protein
VIELSLQAIVFSDDFSIARFCPEIVAQTAPAPAFPPLRVDLRRIEAPKPALTSRYHWPRGPIKPAAAGRTGQEPAMCDIVAVTFDRDSPRFRSIFAAPFRRASIKLTLSKEQEQQAGLQRFLQALDDVAEGLILQA